MCNKGLLCAIQFIIIVAAYLLLVLRLVCSTYSITAVLDCRYHAGLILISICRSIVPQLTLYLIWIVIFIGGFYIIVVIQFVAIGIYLFIYIITTINNLLILSFSWEQL